MKGAYAITHTVCGGVAFYYDRPPVPGTMMRAEHVVGGEAVNGARVICQACGRWVQADDLRANDNGEVRP